MPRKGAVPKRQILPDPRFNSKVLARFINKVMYAGKKSVAERITYEALTIVQEKMGRDPMDVFSQALGNAMPLVEVRPRRVGGATYQVPMEVRPDRRQGCEVPLPKELGRLAGQLAWAFLHAVSVSSGQPHYPSGTHPGQAAGDLAVWYSVVRRAVLEV